MQNDNRICKIKLYTLGEDYFFLRGLPFCQQIIVDSERVVRATRQIFAHIAVSIQRRPKWRRCTPKKGLAESRRLSRRINSGVR